MNNHTVQLVDKRPNTAPNPEDVETLARAVARWYVTMDGKYYDAANPTAKFSREDIQTAAIHRFRDAFPEIVPTKELLREVFAMAIINTSFDPTVKVPTWNGRRQCLPGNPERLIWDQGMVSLNAWKAPAYRSLDVDDADPGTVMDFLVTVLPDPSHRDVFVNWLAWCLQNEDEKPTWGPLLYSKQKGTGKSTLCDIVMALFGRDNSMRQNNVDSLTNKFNMEFMLSKFIVSEELDIRPGTRAANALKTFMTETVAVTEAKGREVQRIDQRFCCMFTTNNLPMWIEEDDRRYWIVELNHSGHAGGPDADAFNELVGNTKAYMACEAHVARLYNWLMRRELPQDFTGKAFDAVKYRTPTMDLIFGNGANTTLDMMREYLDGEGVNVLAEADVVATVVEKLKANPASTKHLMTELGWLKKKVKWGGVDYARAVWVRPSYLVDRGIIYAPDGSKAVLFDATRQEATTYEADLWNLQQEEAEEETNQGYPY